jgi:A/G-specific adenine glycosylase
MASELKIRNFKRRVRSYYKKNRRAFPWRITRNPYFIFVSEVMLQQTQTDRVCTKYPAFLKSFPTWNALAHAPLKCVLKEWQGLGYNRRARLLWEAAREITLNRNGNLPETHDELCEIPGIGPYTASALLAFVHNQPSACIETNIRSVYIHHFFRNRTDVTDGELLPIIEQSLDRKNPREWYYALMDYGVYLKKTIGNPSRKSAHHVRQSPFKGSVREIRGRIVAVLTETGRVSRSRLKVAVQSDTERFDKALSGLLRDRLVRKNGTLFSIG